MIKGRNKTEANLDNLTLGKECDILSAKVVNVMGLTERHWFENEEPELTERQLEDIVYDNKRAYDSGYVKGYSARDNEIVRCKECYYHDENTGDNFCDCGNRPDDWFCADGKRRE